jgi:hypothetical protein
MRKAQDSPRGSYWQLATSALGKMSPRSVLATEDRAGDELVADRAETEQGSHQRSLRCERIRESIGEAMMDHRDVLKEAQSLLSQRGNAYGTVQENHDRAATILSIMTGRNCTPYDVALTLLAVKLSRLAHRPDHHDSWVDGINYMAFCAEFTGKDAPQAVLDLAVKKVQANLNEALRGESNG